MHRVKELPLRCSLCIDFDILDLWKLFIIIWIVLVQASLDSSREGWKACLIRFLFCVFDGHLCKTCWAICPAQCKRHVCDSSDFSKLSKKLQKLNVSVLLRLLIRDKVYYQISPCTTICGNYNVVTCDASGIVMRCWRENSIRILNGQKMTNGVVVWAS